MTHSTNEKSSSRGRYGAIADMPRVPVPTPETQHYWDGTRAGELRLQRCADCRQAYFPPRPFCPRCLSRAVEVFAASGRATLYSYVVNHHPPPDWPQTPYVMAIVALEEGPRMVSIIEDVAPSPDALTIDMPLAVRFRPIADGMMLPVFAPVRS